MVTIACCPSTARRSGMKIIGTTNWKIENGKFWRAQEDTQGIILPVCCQGNIRNCKNWVVLKIEKKSKMLEIYDSIRSIGSLALQKAARQINELQEGREGRKFQVKRIISKIETLQVTNPEDQRVMAIQTINHLAMELAGEPVFQIFANNQVSMQRYYLMFNLELGFLKNEIGRSVIAIKEKELKRDMERRNDLIWQQANKDIGAGSVDFFPQINQWDLVMREDVNAQIEQEFKKWKVGSVKWWKSSQKQKAIFSMEHLSMIWTRKEHLNRSLSKMQMYSARQMRRKNKSIERIRKKMKKNRNRGKNNKITRSESAGNLNEQWVKYSETHQHFTLQQLFQQIFQITLSYLLQLLIRLNSLSN
ncbi:hypothetical protein OXYTRIMIC_053 [Oxytricha trifallax]|uniref:Uncharacterized protein n=1 Tax=Oxytricha trifallax TaxID=1172189 RepID=A0A073I0N1_9SPIT|nr:hypothetical protein OXYTRIMIC_053 [Oxytricha trifallax]